MTDNNTAAMLEALAAESDRCRAALVARNALICDLRSQPVPVPLRTIAAAARLTPAAIHQIARQVTVGPAGIGTAAATGTEPASGATVGE